MNSEFEEYLSRQSFRPIPPEWRSEILDVAGGRRAGAGASASAPWWREWLWPSPKAWGALAAAWVLTLLLHLAAAPTLRSTANVAPATWEAVARLNEEMEMIAQLPDWPPQRQPTAPQPRTCRDVKQKFG